jgi:KEOPS complex subunit Pcc1
VDDAADPTGPRSADADTAAADVDSDAHASGPDLADDASRDAHATVLSFEYADERRARLVADAVAVEVGQIADDRSRATVARDAAAVTVRVDAADLVALRAGCNTWLRLVATAEAVLDAGG